MGRALEDLRILGIHAAQELAPHALGRQLDGGQRILDLVREAPRHLAPGGVALRLQQRGDVVEHQHHARSAADIVRQRRAGAHEHAFAGLGGQLDLLAPVELIVLQPRLHGREEVSEQHAVVDRFVETRADRGLEIDAEDRARRLIGGAHGEIRRERYDARRKPRQDHGEPGSLRFDGLLAAARLLARAARGAWSCR